MDEEEAIRTFEVPRETSELDELGWTREVEDHPGKVLSRTGPGATPVVHVLHGDQLPRICRRRADDQV